MIFITRFFIADTDREPEIIWIQMVMMMKKNVMNRDFW